MPNPWEEYTANTPDATPSPTPAARVPAEDQAAPWSDYGDTAGGLPQAPAQMDLTPMKDYIKTNVENAQEDITGVKKAISYGDALEAGWQRSVMSLMERGKSPNMVLDENADFFMRMASQAGTFAGDIPYMIAGEVTGAAAGAAAGSVVPVLGTAVGGFAGGAAGAFGIPAAMRRFMLETYSKGGSAISAKDFMASMGAATIDGLKEAGVGVATMGAGRGVGVVTSGMGSFASGIAAKTTEAAVMTTASAGLEGHLPGARDFGDAAAFIGGFHAVHALPAKLGNVFVKTGIKPTEVALEAEQNAPLKQDLINGDEGYLPTHYEENAQQDLNLPTEPAPQGEFNLEPPKPNLQERRMSAAKAFDPKAFRDMDSVEKRLSDLAEQRIKIESDQADLETQRVAATEIPENDARTAKLADIQKQSDAKIDELSTVNKQLDKAIQGSDKITNRVNKAYEHTKGLVEATQEERRWALSPENKLNQLADEHANPDFVTPDTTMHVKEPSVVQGELDMGFTKDAFNSVERAPLTDQEKISLMKDTPKLKEETAKQNKIKTEAKAVEDKSHLTESEKKLSKIIGDKEKEFTPPLLERMMGLYSQESIDQMRINYIDRLHALKAAQRDMFPDGKIPILNDFYALAEGASTYTGKTEHFIRHGVLDYNDITKVKTRGFLEIVGKDKNEIEKLKLYMMAQRGLEIQSQGKNAGEKFDKEAALKVVEEGKDKYNKQAVELRQWENAVLKYLKDSGFLSEDQFSAITITNEHHLPWYRVDPKINTDARGNFKSKTKPIKTLEGSSKDIIDPFESMLKNADMYIRMAEVQRAKSAFIRANEKLPVDERFMEEVIDEKKTAADPAEQIANNINDSRVSQSGEDSTFTYVYNGVTRTFKTTTDIYNAFQTLGGTAQSANFLVKTMRGITKMHRAGITFAPDYMIKNLIRDYQTAGTFVEGGLFTPEELKQAWSDIRGKTPAYQNYLKSSGAHATIFNSAHDFIDREIMQLQKSTGALDTAWSTIRNGVDKLAAAGEIAEEMTRLVAFNRKAGANPTMSSLLEGGRASKEATVDFSKVGAKMAVYRSITAFQGAQIQGADRYVRAFQDDPFSTVKRSILTTSVPTLALWAISRGDKRLDELSDVQKNQSFTVPINNWKDVSEEEANKYSEAYTRKVDGKWQLNTGPIFRVPMSQEGGLLFGALLRKTLEKLDTDHPAHAKELASEILGLFTPAVMPDAVAPMYEQVTNKSLFTGNKMVPAYLESRMPEHIYTPYTSEVAKAVGKMVPMVPFIGKDIALNTPFNPIVVDNYIKGWGGTAAGYALSMLDGGVHAIQNAADKDSKPFSMSEYVSALSLSDIPFIKAFVHRQPALGQSVQDFYKQSAEVSKVTSSMAALKSEGDIEGINKLMKDYPVEVAMGQPMKEAQAAMSNMSSAIKKTNANKSMGPMDKKNLSEGMYFMITGAARTMLDKYDEFKNNVAK
jgi:hypothetical protein